MPALCYTRLKKELEELERSQNPTTTADVMRLANLRAQLASVEAFLARTDGIQSLAPLPTGPLDYLDAESTNLYVGSLAAEWTEELIMREFGKFGDVTSIKIMYPRTEQQRQRGMNCGFVQFRTRKQAETAKSRLNGKDDAWSVSDVSWCSSEVRPKSSSVAGLEPRAGVLPTFALKRARRAQVWISTKPIRAKCFRRAAGALKWDSVWPEPLAHCPGSTTSSDVSFRRKRTLSKSVTCGPKSTAVCSRVDCGLTIETRTMAPALRLRGRRLRRQPEARLRSSSRRARAQPVPRRVGLRPPPQRRPCGWCLQAWRRTGTGPGGRQPPALLPASGRWFAGRKLALCKDGLGRAPCPRHGRSSPDGVGAS